MEDDMRISSTNVCSAINQVTEKLADWTNTYLATCKEKQRNRPLNKFARMAANMRRGAGCKDN